MAKLQVAIMVDDLALPRYAGEIVKEIVESDWADVALVIRKQKGYDPYAKSGRFLGYRFLKGLDRKLFGRGALYLDLVKIETLCEAEVFEVQTHEEDFFDTIDAKDLEKLSQKGIDVALNFGFKPSKVLLDFTKYGVWQIEHSHHPAAFWEVLLNVPTTCVTLERVGSALDVGYVLDRFCTVTDAKSMRKNFAAIMWRSHMMVVRNLKRLFEEEERYFETKSTKSYFYSFAPANLGEAKRIDPKFHFSDEFGKRPPTNLESLRLGCKLLGKYAKFTFRRFFEMDRWIILFSENKAGESNPDLSSYKRLPLPSNDCFQADPFVVDEGEKSYLFFEELDYKTLKGYLLVSEYDEGQKSFVNPKEILKKEYHLSYPNVFKVEGKYYMIPETNEIGKVDLYEATHFPYAWQKVRTMLEGVQAVDATLFFYQERWWMFVGIAEKEGFSLNDELYLYYCDDFRTDKWIPHPKNPVVSDVTCARPAGALVQKGERIFRPAQDCSGVYGRGLVINEIKVLSTEDYQEQTIQKIDASFAEDLVAIHTLNRSKRFSVIDAIKSR